MCPLWMFPVEAFEQHRQLRRRQVDFSFTDGRPDEAAAFEAFDEQAQAIVVGPQQLYHVATATTEDKQMPAERVGVERALYARRQAVEAIAHVGNAGDQPDAGARRERYHRCPFFSSRTSVASMAGVRWPDSFRRARPMIISQTCPALALLPERETRPATTEAGVRAQRARGCHRWRQSRRQRHLQGRRSGGDSAGAR